MTSLPNKCYHKVTEEEDHQGIPGKEIWRGKRGWSRQHKTELGGDEWFMACDTPGVTRHKTNVK